MELGQCKIILSVTPECSPQSFQYSLKVWQHLRCEGLADLCLCLHPNHPLTCSCHITPTGFISESQMSWTFCTSEYFFLLFCLECFFPHLGNFLTHKLSLKCHSPKEAFLVYPQHKTKYTVVLDTNKLNYYAIATHSVHYLYLTKWETNNKTCH